jgi:hypothetical protein
MGLLTDGVAGVTAVNDHRQGKGWGSESLTRGTVVSTLEQSPESRRYGCDPDDLLGARAGYQQDNNRAYRGLVRAVVAGRCGISGRNVDARCVS